MTIYLGEIVRPNGYSGNVCAVHLCRDTASGDTFVVYQDASCTGWYTVPAICWGTSLERELLSANPS